MIRSESPGSERGGLGLGGRSGSDREPSQSLFIPSLAGSASPLPPLRLAASGLGSERENPTPSQRRRSDRMPTAAGDAGERNRTIHHSATRYAREPGTGSIALASMGHVPFSSRRKLGVVGFQCSCHLLRPSRRLGSKRTGGLLAFPCYSTTSIMVIRTHRFG